MDGGEAENDNRLKTAPDLLQCAYAPCLLVSQTPTGTRKHQAVKTLAGDLQEVLDWMPSTAGLTREEAIDARRMLRQLACASLLVLTCNYHIRRAKMLFRGQLRPAHIRLRVTGRRRWVPP
jgi:hypothetical protein